MNSLRKLTKVTLFIFAICLAGCLPSKQEASVSFTVDGQMFEIPREYFSWIAKEDASSIGTIEVSWPDFQLKRIPQNFENEAEFNKSRLQIVILRNPHAMKSDLERLIPSSAQYEVAANQHYENFGLKNLVYIGTHERDYFYTLDEKYLVRCSTVLKTIAGPGGCKTQFNLPNSKVKISISFLRQYIDDTPEIIKRVNYFLEQHKI